VANRGDFVDIVAPGSNIVNCDGASYATTGTSTSTALAPAARDWRTTGRSLSEWNRHPHGHAPKRIGGKAGGHLDGVRIEAE